MADEKHPLVDRLLTWFSAGWIGLVVLVNIVAIVGRVLTAETLGEAWSDVASWYSPFNILNWLAELVALLPAIIAYWVRERLRKKRWVAG